MKGLSEKETEAFAKLDETKGRRRRVQQSGNGGAHPPGEPPIRQDDLPPTGWRPVAPGEVFEPGRHFRMNQTTQVSEVYEPPGVLPPLVSDGPEPAGPSANPVADEEHALGIWDAGDDDYVIPPRGWLLGNTFCRGFMSSLQAAGGVGKTALRVAQLLSLAIGRSLTGEHVFQRCRVLIVSFEDGKDELRRRVYAAMRHYGISPEDVKGWLFLATPKIPLRLAEMEDGAPQIGALEGILRRIIDHHKIDVVSLDPFVKSHSLEENSNTALDFVCGRIAAIAIHYDCAMDAPHHTRKGPASPGNADSGRGGSSMNDAARLVFSANPMTTEEANQFGLSEDERRSLIRIDSAKVNIAPPSSEATWFRIVGVPLGNATPLYPKGDNVQTVEPWHPPKLWANMDSPLLNRILDTINAGFPNGSRYSSANKADDRAAWHAVVDHAPDKTEPQAREIIRTWIKNGTLYAQEYDDPGQRKTRSGLFVNATKRPS
jgi:hypothetical protein